MTHNSLHSGSKVNGGVFRDVDIKKDGPAIDMTKVKIW